MSSLNLFQSAPHFSSEANIEKLNQLLQLMKVSIRASLQQRGEHRFFSCSIWIDKFQSAPHFSSEANTSSHGQSAITR